MRHLSGTNLLGTSLGFVDGVIQAHRLDTLRPVIIYGHGAGSDGSIIRGAGPERRYFTGAAKRDFTTVCPGVTLKFGNGASNMAVSAAHTTVRGVNNPYRVKTTGKIPCVGASMGADTILMWARANPTLVSSLTLIIPLISLQVARDLDTLGTRGYIDTAHDVVYPAALPVGTDPGVLTDWAAFPKQVWHVPGDAVTHGGGAFPFSLDDWMTANAHPDDEIYALPAELGHTSAALAAVDTTVMLDFMEAHLT